MGTTINIGDRQYSVYIENDANERLSYFNKEIGSHGLKGNISSCSLLIDLPAGVARGNHSYGGYCVMVDLKGLKSLVRVCDDEMVGHFKLEEEGPMDDWSEICLGSVRG